MVAQQVVRDSWSEDSYSSVIVPCLRELHAFFGCVPVPLGRSSFQRGLGVR